MPTRDNNEPSSDDVKEVYARFGLAYYHAEVLHRGLSLLYVDTQLPLNGQITRPRVEEHLRSAEETTLGQLILRLEPFLHKSLFEKLKQAAERRNFLAHYFWYERIHLMGSRHGIDVILTELAEDTQLFCEADAEIDQIREPLNAKLGITKALCDSLLAEIRGGMPMEPLIRRRKLKKNETVIAVFRAKTTAANYVLMFQTEDQQLWQLCDVGLGWTFHEKPDPSWQLDEKLGALLPSTLNPRPSIASPWNYDLQFGSKGTLSVRTGERPGQIIYKLSIPDKKTAKRAVAEEAS